MLSSWEDPTSLLLAYYIALPLCLAKMHDDGWWNKQYMYAVMCF